MEASHKGKRSLFDLEQQMIEALRYRLSDMGYPTSAIVSDVLTKYRGKIDLVVYEAGKAKIVFELKPTEKLPFNRNDDEISFHPAVRQAQAFAQQVAAPYFAVSDGENILWLVVDAASGRPRQLANPIFPDTLVPAGHDDLISSLQLTNLLYRLYDLGRDKLRSDVVLSHVALALLARLLSEDGDPSLEDLLMNQPSLLEVIEPDLGDLNVADTDFPYLTAFDLLDAINLRQIDPIVLLDELSVFNRSRTGNIHSLTASLPMWTLRLMAGLADIRSTDVALDMFSNAGDGIVALCISGKPIRPDMAYSIAINVTDYLWDRLKRTVLNLSSDSVIRFYSFDEYYSRQPLSHTPTKVFLSPPFGLRVSIGPYRIGEEALIDLSLAWLKPEGRVVVILPDNLLSSTLGNRIRSKILSDASLRAIISLDQYMPGSSIKASIVVFDKTPPQDSPDVQVLMAVFDATSPKDSKDTYLEFDSFSQRVLDAYKRLERNLPILPEDTMWTVPLRDIKLDSWLAPQYLPTAAQEHRSSSPLRQLSEIADLRKGSSLTLDPQGDLPVIGPAAIRVLAIDLSKLDYTSEDRIPSNPVRLTAGDILMHAVGSNRGQTAIVEKDLENYYVSRNVIVLQTHDPRVRPDYLAIALNSTFVKKQLEARSTGSVVRLLSVQQIRNILVPIPDSETQSLIVANVARANRKLAEIEGKILASQVEFTEQQVKFQGVIDTVFEEGGEND